MNKLLLLLLFCILLPLSACGTERDSNGTPTPKTQLDSKQPEADLGNEEVNKENDLGKPVEKETNNDQIIEGVE